jgi:UDP-2,4-diacetamido-2,4,6-trideoxy-beta-L-altropyranose hydrolase
MGHLMRCISIAEQLKKMEQPVLFIVSDVCAKDSVTEKGFPCIALENRYDDKNGETGQIRNIIAAEHMKLLLLDSYEVTESYMRALRECVKLVYMDDLNKFRYPADVVINYKFQMNVEEYAKWNYTDTAFWLGEAYTPLRPEFEQTAISVRNDVKRIFLTTGGTDEYDMILGILNAMEQEKELVAVEKCIVVGKFYQNFAQLRELGSRRKNWKIYHDVSDICSLMRECDIAISAGGTTLSELSACGIPTVCFTMADNQQPGTRAYAAEEMVLLAGDVRENRENVIRAIIEDVIVLVEQKEKRVRLSSRAKSRIDGKGARRIAEKVIKIQGEKHVKVIIIAHNQCEQVKLEIDALRLFAGIERKDIVVADNASEDGLADYLASQEGLDFLVCDEGEEGYGTILNYVIREFQIEEDILILNPCYVALPGSVQEMQRVLYADSQTAAVSPSLFDKEYEQGKDFQAAIQYVQERPKQNRNTQKLGLVPGCVLIKGSMLPAIGSFDDEFFAPNCVVWDFLSRGILKGHALYECGDAFFFELPYEQDYDTLKAKAVQDRAKLKEKWDMNYFMTIPCQFFVQFITEKEDAKLCVLEVGCDCGANLLKIKNDYPNAKLYGLEINPSSAQIAASIAEVQTGNIEEYNMDWGDIRFDYIIFGDVLEHLHDPVGTLNYCRNFLTEEGRVLLSVPNLMHFSVLSELIRGNFTYQDVGLLDRTHIHFFTRKEVMRMLYQAGFEAEVMNMKLVNGEGSDREFVRKLVELSEGASCEADFYTFQYFVKAKKQKEKK